MGEAMGRQPVYPPAPVCEAIIGVAAQSVGNFNARSIASKRGSLRGGSMSGSVF